ncbi:hypothetical protein AAIH46_17615, partial [Rhizobium sp. 0TCS1.26]|uniref:hypothetical protein n=1 Tax=Rhizobium sp. 0TCS1.26 TaxID=3142623 RepID=UPI003D26A0F7
SDRGYRSTLPTRQQPPSQKLQKIRKVLVLLAIFGNPTFGIPKAPFRATGMPGTNPLSTGSHPMRTGRREFSTIGD